MFQHADTILYSASDLVNFLGCTHSTALDLSHLGQPVERVEDEYLALLAKKGNIHERAYLAKLKGEGRSIVEIPGSEHLELDQRVALTRHAMSDGVQVIYQGALFAPPWHGYSDFLLRVDDRPSELGSYAYEVADTKLAHSAKPKHVVQLCVYSELVAREQELCPRNMHVVVGDGTVVTLRVADFVHYCETARGRFASFMTPPAKETAAEPCPHCGLCRWADRCRYEWDFTDHLSLVANITRAQTAKLRDAGVDTIRDLAALPDGQVVPNMQAETVARLRAQAHLQVARRDGGPCEVETLPQTPQKGFARLPCPDDGDLFFDIEGDPLQDGGLEYLFGFDHLTDGGARYTPFWAHDRVQEKTAFQGAVDFMMAHLAEHPGAHVYHYAGYEETALNRLAALHATREAEIDDLLRGRRLVDLYKVVREAVRISEPRYSLKNLEVFYHAPARAGTVTSGGDSIVVYERWRESNDPALLKHLSDYNEIDCQSTRLCRDWLLGLRPPGMEWFTAANANGAAAAVMEEKDQSRRDAEADREALRQTLLDGASDDDKPWRTLLGHLLEFHRREARREWQEMFKRQEMSVEELIADPACIGGLSADPERPSYPVKQSKVHHFRFPAQDFKMRIGDRPRRAGTLEFAGEIVELNEDEGRLALKMGSKQPPFAEPLSLIPAGPRNDEEIRKAIYRYAKAVAEGHQDRYPAITGVLRRETPRLAGRVPGDPVVPASSDLLAGSIDAICSLEESHMLVQGPPGAGKTFTSSHAIVELLAAGKRVGVSSNSHNAINELLRAVEDRAIERGVQFRGVKKSASPDQYLNGQGLIEDTEDNAVAASDHDLVAGTAWLFSRQDLEQKLDYLFVDEAGQVCLANVVAMATSAHNLVLVGDQMQLSYPMHGVHPDGSGASVLEHLLGDLATVPPGRGIFLEKTWRMHPRLCQFISDAVYDGRLEAAEGNGRQRLVLTSDADPEALAPFGLRFVSVAHDGCTQQSAEEAARLCRTYEALLGQRWIDRNGVERAIGVEDILVVSPYNMQVHRLKAILPSGARVGTVDKFQGKEAAVVLISMTTSSGEDIPRNTNFLFSRNRLNVALSRARCLAVVYASPKLLEIVCSSIDEMRLVNTFCWMRTFAAAQPA